MATYAHSTAAPGAQEGALERLFHQYELIHARPLDFEVEAALKLQPAMPSVVGLLAPFFPGWGGGAGDLAVPAPPPHPLKPSSALVVAS